MSKINERHTNIIFGIVIAIMMKLLLSILNGKIPIDISFWIINISVALCSYFIIRSKIPMFIKYPAGSILVCSFYTSILLGQSNTILIFMSISIGLFVGSINPIYSLRKKSS